MKVPAKFNLTLVLSLLFVAFFVSITLALDAQAPTIKNFNPGNNAVVNTSDFTVSFTVYDADDSIKDSDYLIKLDGTALPANFSYKGHWYTDYDYEAWIVDSLKEATISASVSGAKDGVHKVEVQAMDSSGNITNQTWNFTVTVNPVFANMTPAYGTITANNKFFSVKVTDNSSIDPQSIKGELDGQPVTLSFDSSTGVATYQSTIPDGVHQAKVTAADVNGNSTMTSWPFTIQTLGPSLSFAGDGQTYKTSQPTITVDLKSNVKIIDTAAIMQIDGQQITAQFSYKGHWYVDYDYEEWIVDSYKEGHISYTAPSLSDGNHKVTVSSKDEFGNTSNQTWSFSISQPPVFSGLEPVNNSIITGKPTIKAVITDPNGSIDPKIVILTVDGALVTPELAESNGQVTLSYSSDSLANDSYHNIVLSAADVSGNTATTAWKFFSCVNGVQTGFSSQAPADKSNITSNKPIISVHLTDLNRMYDSSKITLKIDNQAPVKPTVTGKYTEFLLTYTPTTTLNDGTHTITVSAPSLTAGATSLTTTWTFNINAPSVITKPSPTYTVISRTPLLSAYAVDNSGLASAKFTVDGQVLNGMIDNKFNRVFLQVPAALAEGTHNVLLSVLDTLGNEATAQWQFNVDSNIGKTYSDMTVANNSTCWQCHQKEYNFGHVQPPQCLSCHTGMVTQMSEFRDCTGCHYNNTYRTSRHSYDQTWVWDNLPNRRHPVNDIHLSTSTGCNECHSRILTKEHARSDRLDKNGKPINCDTCHTDTYLSTVSTDEASKVKNAVVQGLTSCNSCHEQVGHTEFHTSNLETKCANCHNGNLQDEHMKNTTTSGKGYTCNTCHASNQNDVVRAISNNQVSCSSCHSTAHGVPLSLSVPTDVPLYPGLNFSKPIEASIFAEDQGLPTGYEANYQSGLVVFSNRMPVSVSEVWNFYNTQLTGQEWVLKSQIPAADAAYFTAEFEKNGRLLNVRCYKTAFGDNSGPPSANYRIDIWYK